MLIRNVLIKLQLWKIAYQIKSFLFDSNKVNYKKPIDQIFSDIYHSNYWGSKESLSGIGSQDDTTSTVVRDVTHIINTYKIKTIIDIPCGDFYWMKNVMDRLQHDCSYLGLDIVEDLILANNLKYASQSVKFEKCDLTSEDIPQADLVICRDCLVHFSNEFVYAALNNIRCSKSKYLLVTSFEKTKKNVDIHTGQWRPINLKLPPFSMTSPIATFFEKGTEDGYEDNKVLLLYKLDNFSL